MIKRFLDFLHSDEGLRSAGVLMTIALVAENISPPGSVYQTIASKTLQAGVLLGITSSRGKAPKAENKV